MQFKQKREVLFFVGARLSALTSATYYLTGGHWSQGCGKDTRSSGRNMDEPPSPSVKHRLTLYLRQLRCQMMNKILFFEDWNNKPFSWGGRLSFVNPGSSTTGTWTCSAKGFAKGWSWGTHTTPFLSMVQDGLRMLFILHEHAVAPGLGLLPRAAGIHRRPRHRLGSHSSSLLRCLIFLMFSAATSSVIAEGEVEEDSVVVGTGTALQATLSAAEYSVIFFLGLRRQILLALACFFGMGFYLGWYFHDKWTLPTTVRRWGETIMTAGRKHRGHRFNDIFLEDYLYCSWPLSQQTEDRLFRKFQKFVKLRAGYVSLTLRQRLVGLLHDAGHISGRLIEVLLLLFGFLKFLNFVESLGALGVAMPAEPMAVEVQQKTASPGFFTPAIMALINAIWPFSEVAAPWTRDDPLPSLWLLFMGAGLFGIALKLGESHIRDWVPGGHAFHRHLIEGRLFSALEYIMLLLGSSFCLASENVIGHLIGGFTVSHLLNTGRKLLVAEDNKVPLKPKPKRRAMRRSPSGMRAMRAARATAKAASRALPGTAMKILCLIMLSAAMRDVLMSTGPPQLQLATHVGLLGSIVTFFDYGACKAEALEDETSDTP